MISGLSKRFDFPLFFTALALALVGLIFVYSTTSTEELPYSIFFKKQLWGLGTGIVIFFIFSCLDHRALNAWGFIGYPTILCVLFITLVKGHRTMGGRRWLNLIFFRAQPSELTKLLLPAFFIRMLPADETSKLTIENSLSLLVILFMSFLLIAKQPDLGTALLVLSVGLILLWLARMPWHFFAGLFLVVTISSPILWCLLKPYQKRRIAVFLGAEQQDKDRYQVDQSIIAIGSGGFWGKGFAQGSQNKLHFLPENRTDFIFAIVGEEWGFVGALLVLLLYTLLFMRAWYLLYFLKEFYLRLCALGLLLPLMLSVIINVAMTIGMLPVVGIPLPFMSYGISNLWVNWASLGWFCSLVQWHIHNN